MKKLLRGLARAIRGRRRLVDDLPTSESVQFILTPKKPGPSLGVYAGPRGEVRSPGLKEMR